MLILTRRIGETVRIGDDIEIKVMEVKHNGKQVSIGISAPAHIPVFREEVYLRRQTEGALRKTA